MPRNERELNMNTNTGNQTGSMQQNTQHPSESQQNIGRDQSRGGMRSEGDQ